MLGYRWPVALALILCLSFNARAADMPDLATDIINAPSALNGTQQKQLDNYIHAWSDRLISGSDDEVADARAKLSDILDRGGSNVFTSAFIAGLSPQLSHALKASRPTVRVNALIVASRQIDASTVGLALAGLKDDSAAVRYWAAKVIVKLVAAADTGSARYTLTANVTDQTKLLEAGAELLPKEESPEVVAQLVEGLVRLQVPAALDQVLAGLDQRVDFLGAMKDPPLSADVKGLRNVYTTLVEKATKAGKLPDATLKNLALTGYRFMLLALLKLNAAQVNISHQTEYANMVQLGDTILGWVSDQMGATAPKGDINTQLFNKEWPTLIDHRTDEWWKILSNKPFEFTPKDLTVTNVVGG